MGVAMWKAWTVVVAGFLLGYIGTQAESLYDPSEPIVQLTMHNFSVITTTENAWAVEFYAVWCGHCQRFAPIWSQFARDIQGWSRVVSVAAVACSDPVNAALCRKYNVWGYPTVKFFPPRAGEHNGYLYNGGKSVEELRRNVVHFVNVVLPTPPPSWPRLDPVTEMSEVRGPNTSPEKMTFIFFENLNDTDYDRFLSRELILDMSGYDDVIVGRMTKDLADPLGIDTYPSLYQIETEGILIPLAQDLDRDGFRKVLEGSINGPVTLPPEVTTTTQATPSPSYIISDPDGVHMIDLRSALYHSLWLEVGTHSQLANETLEALKDYVRVLVKYYPGKSYQMTFLRQVNRFLRRQETSVTAEAWKNQLERYRNCTDDTKCLDPYSPGWEEWAGCEASGPQYQRGYPCGLWMMFHTLTVKAFDEHIRDSTYDPLEVLTAMRGYVRHFLGCRDCADHFLQMAATLETDVRRREDGVLWLWRAHNKANKRLAGDETEDPGHPKIQFPSKTACPACRALQETSPGKWAIDWDETEMLKYLRNFYGEDDIIQDAGPDRFFGKGVKATLAENFGLMVATRAVTNSTCVRYTGEWSPCSKSCDVGVSVRMSNNNEECQVEMEARLCQVRTCQQKSRSGRCQPTLKPLQNFPLHHGSCETVKSQRWKSCGLCDGKCCYPERHRSQWMRIKCKDDSQGKTQVHYGKIHVMIIDRCKCSDTCPPGL